MEFRFKSTASATAVPARVRDRSFMGFLRTRLALRASVAAAARVNCVPIPASHVGALVTLDSRLRKIIVGVDGSDASLEALRLGRDLAEQVNAHLEAITCWTFPQLYEKYIMDGFEIYKESAAKVLDQSVARVYGPELPRNVGTRLMEGNTKVSLINASGDADLLILGRRGQGGFSGLHVGSVSSSCVAHAKCPVLVVQAPDSHESD